MPSFVLLDQNTTYTLLIECKQHLLTSLITRDTASNCGLGHTAVDLRQKLVILCGFWLVTEVRIQHQFAIFSSKMN